MPDCFAAKKAHAFDNMHGFNLTTKKKELLSQEYEDPKAHQYRDLKEIVPGMKDFVLRPKIDQIDNPKGLSAFTEKPKYIADKEKELMDKLEKDRKFAEANKPHDWRMFQTSQIPSTRVNIGSKYPDKHNRVNGPEQEQSAFLQKDSFVPAYLELARTMKDDFVYGKPKLDLYYIGLKPEQVN